MPFLKELSLVISCAWVPHHRALVQTCAYITCLCLQLHHSADASHYTSLQSIATYSYLSRMCYIAPHSDLGLVRSQGNVFFFFWGGGGRKLLSRILGKLLSRIFGKIPYQPKSKAAFNRLPNHHTTQMPAKKNIHGSHLAVKKHFRPSPRFGNCVSNPYVRHMYEQMILTWWYIRIALIIEINKIYALEIEK